MHPRTSIRRLAAFAPAEAELENANPFPLRRLRLFIRRLLVLAVTTFWASAAHAAPPVLFHSVNDDGVAPTGIPQELGMPMVTLFLYLDAGATSTTAGTACVDGNGDELCAWEWVLLTNGGASIQGFVPDPGQNVVSRVSATELAGIGGDAVAGELGPIRLGEVDLNITAPA